MDLFQNEKIILPLKDGVFEYYPTFFSKSIADELYEKLIKETPWQHDNITVFGKTYPQPRLTALFGNNGKNYQYSNIVMKPHPFNPTITYIKDEIEKKCATNFTTVLANLYRNEKDSNGWHADNEKELGLNPIIASVTLGESRVFQIKHRTKKEEKINLILDHGSLLLMKEGSQIHYMHQIPKSNSQKKPRINLTFRTIF